ncbi:1,4-alpha-glucan branching protein GlgB [Nitrospirillum viridazoti]|uniref:1,4-alpha-glucan branching enzyme GlgB n=1 Tax=Nitrospirillum amazonense TaxID=28077 RepID=A0A560HNX5_9PROT|nr:1,4-alpha-glucan branching protein GlgB [Nitrospirillum amazonense]TWB48266.1 1,4-alpha-glucan branching enzyme [Nitrospirillum amazonense]
MARTKGEASWTARQEDMDALLGARHDDPFGVLGPHVSERGVTIRAFVPGAETVEAATPDGTLVLPLTRVHEAGLFEGRAARRKRPFRYRLHCANAGGAWEFDDPYSFGPLLGPMDDYLFAEGTHRRLYEKLGAHLKTHESVDGVHFAVWAPNARRVSVVGDFNGWDGRRHQMRRRLDSGVWEIFAPGLGQGAVYKYEIVGPDDTVLPLKADPFGFASELRPSTASVVTRTDNFTWADDAHMAHLKTMDARRSPISIYEVHLGSWRRGDGNRYLTWDELADQLVPYAADMGFTHLEFLPISEFPFDPSWGYQPIGLFAPTARFGTPDGFARLVDRAHRAGLGVLLDWVPAHFPTDVHGLARFDGTALYEHADPRQGFHPDWKTAIYNFGRHEVVNYLAANALYWIDRFHVDGLRVDAVASMLYLDYSRKDGEWIPNREGGNQNLEAVAFLQAVNTLVYGEHPGAITVAEESTSWPGVSQPTYAGGLGFGFKWNMGWMHDTLEYVSKEPVHRKWHHDKLTFGLLYAFSENFVLPLSHDEVVYGKRSIIEKMPGDDWQKFATARAYYAFMWGHPGKKLLFMGQEFGQRAEWNFQQSLDWHLLAYPAHEGLRRLVRDLNAGYRRERALYETDCVPEGFRWIVADDKDQSVFAFLRLGGEGARPVAVLCNFTPVPRPNYRVGLPAAGRWLEILNTDAGGYGGTGMGNLGAVTATDQPAHGLPASAVVTLPPLATLWLALDEHQS